MLSTTRDATKRLGQPTGRKGGTQNQNKASPNRNGMR